MALFGKIQRNILLLRNIRTITFSLQRSAERLQISNDCPQLPFPT